MCYIIECGSQDSLVGIVTRLWAGCPWNLGSLHGGDNKFFSFPVSGLVLGSFLLDEVA